MSSLAELVLPAQVHAGLDAAAGARLGCAALPSAEPGRAWNDADRPTRVPATYGTLGGRAHGAEWAAAGHLRARGARGGLHRRGAEQRRLRADRPGAGPDRRRRPPAPARGVRVPQLHADRHADERRRAHAGPPRRHGRVLRRPEPVPARPQPRGQRTRRRLRQRRQGLRREGRWRHHHARGQPARDEGRVLGELQRHADELRRRGDPVGQLAHVRGDGQRPRRRQRLHGRQQQPARAEARVCLRGPVLLERGRARQAGADPLRRPVRARGGRHRPPDGDPLHDRGQLRLPVGLLPLHRSAEPADGQAPDRRRDAGDAQDRGHAPTRCSTRARRRA